jgi:hypothetical protein
VALHHLPARRAALGRGVRKLVASLRAVADPLRREGERMEHDEQRRGSAAIALRRLSHPGRDGGGVAEGDQLSEVSRRLSELLAVVERRTVEHPTAEDHSAPPRLVESVAPAAPVQAAPPLEDDGTGWAAITLRFDTGLLARIDAAAKRLGITRTAWLHIAASDLLEGER